MKQNIESGIYTVSQVFHLKKETGLSYQIIEPIHMYICLD